MKIRVGFIINYTLNKWLGISYYYENLFKTIIDQNDNKIEIVILTDEHITEEETKKFEGIEIIKSKLFDRKSSRWKTRSPSSGNLCVSKLTICITKV